MTNAEDSVAVQKESAADAAAAALYPRPSLDCSWLSRKLLNSSTFSSSIHSVNVWYDES